MSFQRTTVLLTSDPPPRFFVHCVFLCIVDLKKVKTLSYEKKAVQRLSKDLGRLLGELFQSSTDDTLITGVAADSGEGDGKGGVWSQDFLVPKGLDLEEL